MTKNFGPKIEGIDLPQAIYLPPEIVPLIPWMGLAELKIVIIAVAEEMRIGGSEPLSLSDFQEKTGLSRTSVMDGIKNAIERGVLSRRAVEGYRGHSQYKYELNYRVKNLISSATLPIKEEVVKLSESLIEGRTDSLRETDSDDVKKVYIMLKNLGLYERKAQKIFEMYPEEYIMRYIRAYRKAKGLGKANGPGWLSNAIEQGWDINEFEEIVYHDGSEEDRNRYISGEYSEFVNH